MTMATWINVLCRAAEPVTYAELADVMNNMGGLDEAAELSPPANGPDSGDWGLVSVRYAPTKRPVIVHQKVTREEMEPSFEDLREKIEDLPAEHRATLEAWMAATQRLFIFEVQGDPPDDVWEMLAVTQSFLARERDGIVVADEAVYNAALERMFDL